MGMGIQVHFSSVSPSSYGYGSTGYAQSKGAYPDLAVASPQTSSNTISSSKLSPIDQDSDSFQPNSEKTQTQETTLPPTSSKDTSKAEEASTGEKNTEADQEKSTWGSRAFAELSQAEKQLVNQLKQRDTRVRNHEMSHLAAAGALAMSGASYEYQKGPDGKKYAVGGEVHIDTAPVPGDPEATLQKMQQVKRAALAPADPSSQDRRVAAKATAAAAKARAEIMYLTAENTPSSQSTGYSFQNSSDMANGDRKESDVSSAPFHSFALTA